MSYSEVATSPHKYAVAEFPVAALRTAPAIDVLIFVQLVRKFDDTRVGRITLYRDVFGLPLLFLHPRDGRLVLPNIAFESLQAHYRLSTDRRCLGSASATPRKGWTSSGGDRESFSFFQSDRLGGYAVDQVHGR